jgi:hypothetical protein
MNFNKILNLIWGAPVNNKIKMEEDFIQLVNAMLFYNLQDEFMAEVSLIQLEDYI